MRLLVTTLILTMLAQPVWAGAVFGGNGKTVYFCETIAASAGYSSWVRDLDDKSYRFKMAVGSEGVDVLGKKCTKSFSSACFIFQDLEFEFNVFKRWGRANFEGGLVRDDVPTMAVRFEAPLL